MAFNPLKSLRKHNKTFFAVMLIVCMFVFILQFGAGDIFSRGMGWFGSFRERGSLLTSLHGTSIYQADVGSLERQRTMASDFLIMVHVRAMQQAEQENFKIFDKIEGIARQQAIQRAQGNRSNRQMMENFRRQMEARGQFSPELQQLIKSPEQKLVEIREDLAALNLHFGTGGAGLKPEEQRAVGELIAALQFEAWSIDPKRATDIFFFGGSKKTDDLLDFWLWRYQADRLGIQLTDTDVLKALANDCNGRQIVPVNKPFGISPEVQFFLANEPQNRRGQLGFTAQDLLKALNDEFRMVMAKEALLGLEAGYRAYRGLTAGINHSPAAPTPDQFLNYYRHNLTRLGVAFLPVAVERFVPEIKSLPSQKTLEDLFQKYRTQEPAPERDQPGFKTPRRVRVQYVSGKADLPYYQQASQVLALHPGLMRWLMPFTMKVPGAAGIGPVWGYSWPLFHRDDIDEEYKNYKDRENRQPWIDQHFYRSVHDVSVLRLGTLGFSTTQILGSVGLNTGPLATSISAGASLIGNACQYEAWPRETMRSIDLTTLATLQRNPGATGIAGALAMAFQPAYAPIDALSPWMPAVLPKETFEGRFFKDVKERLAPNLVNDSLHTIEKELRERRKKPEDAAKYVETAIKQYGLETQFHTMKEPKDRYSLGSDPEMQPFKTAFEQSVQNRFRKLDYAFADLFFVTTGVYEPQRWPNFPETYLYWRVEDLKAHEPATLAEVRGQVEAAWRFMEARREARTAADAILKQLPKDKKISTRDQLVRWLRDLKADKKSDLKLNEINPDDVFELNDITRLVDSRLQPLAGRGKTYRLYQPPETRIAYPRTNFADQLLRLEKPGDAMVLSDLPEKQFYVAVLQFRSVPTVEEFASVYSGTPFGNPLWRDALLEDFVEQYRNRFMYQMRLDAAGKVDSDGKLILPPQEEREDRRAPLPFED